MKETNVFLTMKSKILEQIKKIEEQEDIKVLFLIESGSRAWGWESEDSDYDVRGVYVQNYNQFKDFKNQINLVSGDLDIELWDLKKFLTLMRKSNPSVWEWLSSDIIYLDNSVREELKKEFVKGFSRFSLKKHYVSMARQNFQKYINQIGDTANLKKYTYVLRSIACINYIEDTGLPPPKNYKNVVSFLPENLINFFEKIVEDKKKSESLEGKRNYEAEQYIINFFNKQFKRDNSRFTKLRELFDRSLEQLILKNETSHKIENNKSILGRKKDGSDSSNDDHLGTRNTAGEGNKYEHMPVSAITLNSVENHCRENNAVVHI